MRAETVVCCGHAPNLDAVIAHVVGACDAFTSLKKAGAACLELPSLRAASGSLLWLHPPAALRRLHG
jgi:phosphohistidine phosphatase SixA